MTQNQKTQLYEVITDLVNLRSKIDTLMYSGDDLDETIMNKLSTAHDYLCKALDELI